MNPPKHRPGPCRLIPAAHLNVDSGPTISDVSGVVTVDEYRERKGHLTGELVDSLGEHVERREDFVVQEPEAHLGRGGVEAEGELG